MRTYEFGTEPKMIGTSCDRWGSYVVTDLDVEDELLASRIARCVKALIDQHRRSAAANGIEIIEDSMEIIIKKNPDWQINSPAMMASGEPKGTIAIKYMAWRDHDNDNH